MCTQENPWFPFPPWYKPALQEAWTANKDDLEARRRMWFLVKQVHKLTFWLHDIPGHKPEKYPEPDLEGVCCFVDGKATARVYTTYFAIAWLVAAVCYCACPQAAPDSARPQRSHAEDGGADIADAARRKKEDAKY